MEEGKKRKGARRAEEAAEDEDEDVEILHVGKEGALVGAEEASDFTWIVEVEHPVCAVSWLVSCTCRMFYFYHASVIQNFFCPT